MSTFFVDVSGNWECSGSWDGKKMILNIPTMNIQAGGYNAHELAQNLPGEIERAYKNSAELQRIARLLPYVPYADSSTSGTIQPIQTDASTAAEIADVIVNWVVEKIHKLAGEKNLRDAEDYLAGQQGLWEQHYIWNPPLKFPRHADESNKDRYDPKLELLKWQTKKNHQEWLEKQKQESQEAAGDTKDEKSGDTLVTGAGPEGGSVNQSPSFIEQQAHSLGVGTRPVVDGLAGGADLVATPMRLILNWVNGKFGGDPNYFKPIGSQVSDSLGLPKPRNTTEEYISAIAKGGTEALVLSWGAGLIMAQKAAASVPGMFWEIVKVFKTGPVAQVGAGAGAEAGKLTAEKSGAGPFATFLAAIAGGMLGSKAMSTGAAAGAVAKNMARKTSTIMGYSPAEFTTYVHANKDAAVKQYLKDFGSHLDLDEARKYCGAYAESAEGALKHTQATHAPAGELIAAVYEHLLKQQPGAGKRNLVTFGGGAGGSGKSTGLFENPAFEKYLGTSQVTYDTTLAGSRGLDRVDQALKAGKDVDILFVVRDPLEAITSSFTRAKNTGRFIPLDVLADMHLSARDNIRKAATQYAGDKRVAIHFVDNTGAKPNGLADSSLLDKINYNNLHQRAREALEKEYKNGNIPEKIYRGILSGAD